MAAAAHRHDVGFRQASTLQWGRCLSGNPLAPNLPVDYPACVFSLYQHILPGGGGCLSAQGPLTPRLLRPSPAASPASATRVSVAYTQWDTPD